MKNFIGLIEKNFLTESEVHELQHKVLENKHMWNFNGPTGFFPNGLYYKNGTGYLINVKTFEKLLEQIFSNFYEKILLKIENIFNQRINYNRYYHKPGFHIFGPGPLIYQYVNNHIDRFDNVHGKIYSFIIPIQIPLEGAGLIYYLHNQKFERTAILQNHHILDYVVSNLYMWDGDIIHSIKPFSLLNNEYRITCQFHVSLNTTKSMIFW